ncbi:glutathione S-transferase-like [Neocloeon triangulifer]|uniref:glutathione S-transferase-like n=1 Tax=Neocloeon triangulifer TaxID=2078957 RepID=UPI00286EF1EB|nr:glutathione S-transferase-like [Neocloeon triangulifer]
MAPTKLTYFGLTGRGEPIRFLLSYGGVVFEDERMTFEEFHARKEEFPLGQVPVLSIEGQTIYQTVAICRFLAKRFDLVGKDEWDALNCDIAIDTINDIGIAMLPFATEKDEEVKKQKREAAMGKINYLIDKLESQLKKNNGHFVKGQLTFADFYFAGVYSAFVYRCGEWDLFADKPLLKALKSKVESLPAVRAYIEKRPPGRIEPSAEENNKMPETKLTYFGLTGLGEGIRYLLTYAGVDFEDLRITREEFATLKEKYPLGQVPVLEFEGKTLYQSKAICRFLAKRFNLAGKDEWDALWCDVAVDTIADVGMAMIPFASEDNAEAKSVKKAAAMTKIAYLTEKLENQLAKNDGHFLKGQLSWADFYFAAIYNTFNYRADEYIFANRPKLKALKEKIDTLPAIRAYLEKRPSVPF